MNSNSNQGGLSTWVVSPSFWIAPNEILILQSEREFQKICNEMKKDTMAAQQTAFEIEGKAIINSYTAQSNELTAQGRSQIMSGLMSGGMSAFGGFKSYQANMKISSLREVAVNGEETIKSLNGGHEERGAAQSHELVELSRNGVSSTISAGGKTIINGTPEDVRNYFKGQKHVADDGTEISKERDIEIKKSQISADAEITDPNAAAKPDGSRTTYRQALKTKIKEELAKLTQEIDQISKDDNSQSQATSIRASSAASVAQHVGSMSAATQKTIQGEAEKEKMQFEMAQQFIKGYQAICDQGADWAREQRAGTFQTMEQSIVTANHRA